MTTEGNQSNALILRAQAGEKEAMDQLVRENIALVKYVVKRYMNRGREYDDLFQLGCLGLVKAIQNFDTSFNVRFSTYAVPVILGEIRRFLRDDSLLRVSRSIKENAQKACRYVEQYAAAHGREPTPDEISAELGLSREDVMLAVDSMRPARSLSEPVGDEGSLTLQDTLGEDGTREIDDRIEVQQLLSRLDEKERVIMTRRYFDQHTQSQIAADMGMTQVQVSRLESKIIKRLREIAQAG